MIKTIVWIKFTLFILCSPNFLFSTIRYVSHYTNNPVYPYTNPSQAATNINDALQAAGSGDVIKIIDSYRNYQGFSIMAWSDACNLWWAEPTNIIIKAEPPFNPAVSSPGCYSIGIFIGQRNSITISNIDVININTGQPGIKVQGSSNCKILDCTVSNINGNGIYISDDSGRPTYNLLIKKCKIVNNTDVGIKIDSSHFNKIEECKILRNGNDGIYFGTTSINNKILKTEIAYNGDDSFWDNGIEISEWGNSKKNLIQECSIYSNAANGVLVSTSTNGKPVSNVIFKSLIYRNGSDGINIYNLYPASGGNRVEYCTLFDNGNNGVAIDSDDILKNSIIVSNNAYGVWGYNNPVISYCCLYGNNFENVGNSGTLNNCISDNPQFVSTIPGSEDFHLKYNSPCLNSAEPHNNQRASIGRYTACVVLEKPFVTNSGYHNFIWVSSLSNNLYTSGTVIKIYYSKEGGLPDFKLNNVTQATSSTSWGPDFSSESGNSTLQMLNAVVNHSISTLGLAENISFLNITNGSPGTNSFNVVLSNSSGKEVIDGNQFRVYPYTPVHYVSFYTNNPVFPYDTPSTASTDIQTVIKCGALSPGDKIIIIDNYKHYSGIFMDSSAPSGVKIYAEKGFSPAISNSQFTYNNGIYINGPDNITISNLIIKNNNGDGISINNSDNSIIISNNIYYNKKSGIGVRGCNNIKIIGNEIWSNGNNTSFTSEYAGIYFWTNTLPGALIKGNNIHHNPANIKIIGGPVSFTLYNNLCNNAQNSNDYGFNIYIAGGKKNTIISNLLGETWFNARNMKLTWSDSNLIKFNKFKNSDSGVRLQSARGNIISHNFITNCGLGIFLFKGIESFAPFSSSNFIFTNRIMGCSRGIYIERGVETRIVSNILISHTNGIQAGTTYSGGADRCFISNNVIKKCKKGIEVLYSNGSKIKNNLIKSNREGIKCTLPANDCEISGGSISFNSNSGLFAQGSNFSIKNISFLSNSSCALFITNSKLIRSFSNVFAYNSYPVRLKNSTSSTIFRSAIFKNTSYGISIESQVTNISLVNNSIISNSGDGIKINGGIKILTKNTISAFNSGYGINLVSGSCSNIYSDFYANASGNTGGGAGLSKGCISEDPLFASFAISSTNFLKLTINSPCIDAGDPSDTPPPNGGPYIDIGWKEFTSPYVHLSIVKTVSNIKLGSNPTVSLPGATIQYLISYEIKGNKSATNIIIYDHLSPFVTYRTAFQGSATGWSIEWSTNSNPDQSYNSIDYTSIKPQNEKIKWVRWKKNVESNTYGYKTLNFWCIIK